MYDSDHTRIARNGHTGSVMEESDQERAVPEEGGNVQFGQAIKPVGRRQLGNRFIQCTKEKIDRERTQVGRGNPQLVGGNTRRSPFPGTIRIRRAASHRRATATATTGVIRLRHHSTGDRQDQRDDDEKGEQLLHSVVGKLDATQLRRFADFVNGWFTLVARHQRENARRMGPQRRNFVQS